jgi:hypothetical protein
LTIEVGNDKLPRNLANKQARCLTPEKNEGLHIAVAGSFVNSCPKFVTLIQIFVGNHAGLGCMTSCTPTNTTSIVLLLHVSVFNYAMPRRLLEVTRRFVGTCCFHPQCGATQKTVESQHSVIHRGINLNQTIREYSFQ